MSRAEGGKDRPSIYEQDIRSAFDLGSGGIGVHFHAVAALAEGKELPTRDVDSLRDYSCNFLANPYVATWAGTMDEKFGIKPKSLTPRTLQHRSLIHETLERYHRLGDRKIRLLLTGEEGITGKDASRLTTNELITELMPAGIERGILPKGMHVEIWSTPHSLTGLMADLLNSRVQVGDSFWEGMKKTESDQRFLPATLQAAVYKLGAMLGGIDQVTYEAAQQGKPIARTFRPFPHRNKWEEGWQRSFGEPLPTLEELYSQAHTVFVANTDRQDPLVAHLVELNELPQLAA